MKAQEHVTGYWNERGGETYDAQPLHTMTDPAVAAAWRAVVAQALPAGPADLLDVGTGTGFVALLAAERGHRVVGTDLSETMLATARAKTIGLENAPRFEIGDAISPQFPPASFDVVTSRHLLWTLTDPERALRSWFDLLRPGGRILAWDGLWWHAGLLAPRDDAVEGDFGKAWQQHYSDDVLAALPLARLEREQDLVPVFTAAGFIDVRLEYAPELDAAQRAAADADLRDRLPPTLLVTGVKPG